MESEYHLDRNISEQIARKIDALPKHCWHNAVRAMKHLPTNARYVEGVVLVDEPHFMLEHGWCEVGNTIIDPTLYQDSMIIYMPGLSYSQSQIAEYFPSYHVPPHFEMPLVWSAIHPSGYHSMAMFNAAWEMARAIHFVLGRTE